MRHAIILILFMLSGCCSHELAVKALDRGIAANIGHMEESALPVEAREIAQDNYDFMHQVKFNLDGTPVPSDTAARAKAREAATAVPLGGGR